MVYTIGFGKRNSPDVLSVIERNTAKEALELAEALEQRDEEIRFIDAPTDGRVGMNMLHVLAKEEAGEAWPPREPSLGQAGKEARGPGALETAALEGALRLIYAAIPDNPGRALAIFVRRRGRRQPR